MINLVKPYYQMVEKGCVPCRTCMVTLELALKEVSAYINWRILQPKCFTQQKDVVCFNELA
jgi:hypothetical protein